MDDVAGQTVAVNGDEQQQYEEQIQLHFSSDERGHEQYDNLDDSAGNDIQHSLDENSRDSSAGKLFVGGIAWETTEESFSNYFSNYGQIMDSVIMMDKVTGRPRGFGFVTFVDPSVADKVLEEEHVIDGRPVEVKRTVPREDKRMQVKGVVRTKKIFVGGIPLSLTEDDLREYFSSYGNVLEQQIMLDHTTGRSRGFGFVTFDTEDAVDKIFSDGQLHELGGKQVEIKKAEPKRPGSDYGSDSRMRRGGSSSRSYGGGGGSGRAGSYGGGYGGKMGRGYGGGQGNYGSYDDYGGYSSYGGNYGGGAASFYPGYGAGYGYGFGFGGPMYGSGYGGSSYGTPSSYGAAAGYEGKEYGSGGAYGGRGYGGSGYDGGKGYSSSGGSGYDGGREYGSGSGGGGGGRYHPYRK